MNTTTTDTALLIMDMQTAILRQLPDAKPFTDKVSRAIATAHARNIPVIYVVVGFRQGMPEVSANNKGFSARKAVMATVDMTEWMKIDPSVSPQNNEIVVVKRRFSAFTGSDLEVVLRSMNIRHLILTGISTSGVVLSTVREAADKDYEMTVLSDCCVDGDAEVHRVLMEKVFPRQADVHTLKEWEKR